MNIKKIIAFPFVLAFTVVSLIALTPFAIWLGVLFFLPYLITPMWKGTSIRESMKEYLHLLIFPFQEVINMWKGEKDV